MRRVDSPTAPCRPAIVLLSLFLAAGGTAGASSRAQGPYRVLAGPYSRQENKAGTGHSAARTTLKGLTITVEFLGREARAAFVNAVAPSMPDPFAVRPGRAEIYSTFRVAFDNQSPADALFQAGNVVMITDRKTQDFPVDLTDLYRVAEEIGAADPERTIDRIAPIIFDSSTTIPRGRTIERLLVFGQFPEKWKEFVLHFSFLQIGTETLTVSFHFHKQPLSG